MVRGEPPQSISQDNLVEVDEQADGQSGKS